MPSTDQAKHARLRVARLWSRGDGPHFDESESEASKGVDMGGGFVEACRQAHRIREVKSHHAHRQRIDARGDPACDTEVVTALQRGQCQVVRSFGIKRKEKGARELIKHARILRGRLL